MHYYCTISVHAWIFISGNLQLRQGVAVNQGWCGVRLGNEQKRG